MKRIFNRYIFPASLFLLPLAGHAFSTDFSSGIPSGMITTDYSQGNVITDAFKCTPALNTWYSDFAPDEATLSKEGRAAALSISYRDKDAVTDNWLITPTEEVKEGTILSWTAKSIHHVLLESYDILISDTGDTDPASFRLLTSIQNEGNMFTRHAIDLGAIPELIGKKVRVAFAHRSNQGFILALSQLSLGQPVRSDVWCEGVNIHYLGADDSDPHLKFRIHNYGQNAELTNIRLVYPDGEYKGENLTVNSLEEGTISIAMPDLKVGDAYFYELKATIDGKDVTLFTDFVNRSHFRRKMLLEKYTGSWCNSCPKVVFHTEMTVGALGDEVIYVEPHSGGSASADYLAANGYCSNMPNAVRGDYPAVWFNRYDKITNYLPRDRSAYTKAALIPCKAEVKITDATITDDNIIVNAVYTFAEDIDNSSGLVRPAFTVIEDKVPYTKGSRQTNNATAGLYYGEAHFMTSPLHEHFMIADGVVRGSDTGSCGDEGFFPAEIVAGTPYIVNYTMQRPSNIINAKNCAVVATAVDGNTKTYEVLNADKKELSSISFTLTPESLTIKEGETASLNYNGLPEIPTVTVSNDCVSVVKVADGIISVKGEKEGVCALTAVFGNHTATCEITVEKPLTLTLNPKTITIEQTETVCIAYEGTSEQPEITLSNDCVLLKSVNDGFISIEGQKVGDCVLTASYGDLSATCDITVTEMGGLTSITDKINISANKDAINVDWGYTENYTVRVVTSEGMIIASKSGSDTSVNLHVGVRNEPVVLTVTLAGKTTTYKLMM